MYRKKYIEHSSVQEVQNIIIIVVPTYLKYYRYYATPII